MPTQKYTPSTVDVAKAEKAFTFHPVHGDQAERYPLIRAKAKELAYLMMEQCPPSHELSVALTELQSSVMWANAAIAVNEDKADQP